MEYHELLNLCRDVSRAEAHLEEARKFSRAQNHGHHEYVLAAWNEWRRVSDRYRRAIETHKQERAREA